MKQLAISSIYLCHITYFFNIMFWSIYTASYIYIDKYYEVFTSCLLKEKVQYNTFIKPW